MSNEEEHTCPFDLDWTREEEEALAWLQHNLQEAASKCDPTSRLSFIAYAAIGKAITKAHGLHDKVHALEVELMEAEMLMTGIAGLPQRVGLVKKEDLN